MVKREIKASDSSIERAITFVFSAAPVLMSYICIFKLPFVNVSMGTAALIILALVSLICFLLGRAKKQIGPETDKLVTLFLVLYTYRIFRCEGQATQIILCAAAAISMLGLAYGMADFGYIRKILEWFAIVNAALIIAQVFSYYLLKKEIQFIPQSIVHSSFQNSYIFRDEPGLYRPSALFLEPSHFAEFCCFALISVVFPEKGRPNWLKAAIIALGCILTTSGMGIALTFGIAGWLILFGEADRKTRSRRIIAGIVGLLVVFIILMQVPFFKTAFQRVFAKVDGYNALGGRTRSFKYVLTMPFLDFLFGYGSKIDFPYYLSGLPDTIFKYGILDILIGGAILFIIAKSRRSNFTLCWIVAFSILFCFAHLTGYFAQLFYFGILLTVKETSSGSAQQPVPDTKDLQSVSDEELKQIELAVLKETAAYCEANGLRYSLACGTALGAIRHKGFIPWDDDIDICMPRPDYERFISDFTSETCRVCSHKKDRNYPYAFAKVCDNSTVLLEQIDLPAQLGVYIDVFPVDGVPVDSKDQKRFLKKVNSWMRVLSWKRISRESKVGAVHKAVQIIAKRMLVFVPVAALVNKLDQTVQKYDFSKSELAGHLVTRARWGNDVKPKSLFEQVEKKQFETEAFFLPKDYDKYLSLEYGDYMKLPPKEKQVSVHSFSAFMRKENDMG